MYITLSNVIIISLSLVILNPYQAILSAEVEKIIQDFEFPAWFTKHIQGKEINTGTAERCQVNLTFHSDVPFRV